jgi:hypothetical protein
MLSVESCQKILNSNGKNYTQEEIKKIRDFLYLLGEIDYEQFKEIEKNKQSSHIHPSQNGCKERVKAEQANLAFSDYLKSFQVRSEVSNLYMAIMEDIFKTKEGEIERKKSIAIRKA